MGAILILSLNTVVDTSTSWHALKTAVDTPTSQHGQHRTPPHHMPHGVRICMQPQRPAGAAGMPKHRRLYSSQLADTGPHKPKRTY